MPGPDQSTGFKYFMQTLPMTDSAWAAAGGGDGAAGRG